MPAIINREVFEVEEISSAKIGLLGVVIHPLNQIGAFSGEVTVGSKVVRRFQLVVKDEGTEQQLNVDLSERALNGKKLVTKQGSYVVFHVTRGSQKYGVNLREVTKLGKLKRVFSSNTLRQGDLFAVTILQPGRYAVDETRSGAKANLDVVSPKVGVPPHLIEPARIQVSNKGFLPKKIDLCSGQGHVYDIQAPASIRIALKQKQIPRAEKRPVAKWVNKRRKYRRPADPQ